MRVYLAGKIGFCDWRWLIVRGLKEHLETLDPATMGWPILEASIHGIHSFSGPFFAKIDKSDTALNTRPAKIHRLCLEAIDSSDLVFAWVDDPTCYATIYEMGYAAAKGKYTAVAYPPGFDKSELWFMSACSDEIIETSSPEIALIATTMKALRSGKIAGPLAELERVERNLARLQGMALGGVHGMDRGSNQDRDHESVGSVGGGDQKFDSDEPPTNPQTIESKKKSGNYPAVQPEDKKEGNGDE